jgi:hypothetical protein
MRTKNRRFGPTTADKILKMRAEVEILLASSWMILSMKTSICELLRARAKTTFDTADCDCSVIRADAFV